MAFENLKTDNKIKDQGDYLGGVQVFDSATYPMKINLAYQGLSRKGANSLNITFKAEDGRELRHTFWVTGGKEKGQNNFYLNKKTGEKQYLPGFMQANSLSLLAAGKELSDLITEDKVIKIYDFDAKKEIPTTVPVFTELLDQSVILGLIKQVVDKNKKGDDGEYHPTGETREENDVDKIFRASDGLTVTEIKAGADHPVFKERWEDKWNGQTKNRSKGVAGKEGMPAAASASKTAPKLFE